MARAAPGTSPPRPYIPHHARPGSVRAVVLVVAVEVHAHPPRAIGRPQLVPVHAVVRGEEQQVVADGQVLRRAPARAVVDVFHEPRGVFSLLPRTPPQFPPRGLGRRRVVERASEGREEGRGRSRETRPEVVHSLGTAFRAVAAPELRTRPDMAVAPRGRLQRLKIRVGVFIDPVVPHVREIRPTRIINLPSREHRIASHANDARELLCHQPRHVKIRPVRIHHPGVLVRPCDVGIGEPEELPRSTSPHKPVPAAETPVRLLLRHVALRVFAAPGMVRHREEVVPFLRRRPVKPSRTVVRPVRYPRRCFRDRVPHGSLEGRPPKSAAGVRVLKGEHPRRVYPARREVEVALPSRQPAWVRRHRAGVQIFDHNRPRPGPISAPQLLPAANPCIR
mmetsp:Transcript_16870/g.22666  ORF Transcript_16870/g.22666 Transcript_16870/m.22666 type:complete len:393 (-) Transcript_16870:147-1325(-)